MNAGYSEYAAAAAGFLLVLLGLWAIMTQKNIIKMIIGFSIFDTGLHVIIVSVGYIRGKTAPIFDSTVNMADAAAKMTDPVPQALVLTTIVIGLGITALMLSYALKLHRKRKTLDINEFEDLKW